MKILGLKNQGPTPFSEKKKFENNTGYLVGKIKIIDKKPFIITAITYITEKRFSIYAMPAEQPMKLEDFKTYQQQRESGKVNVYLPGKRLFDVVITD